MTTVGTSHVHFTDTKVFLNFKCTQTMYQNPVHLLGKNTVSTEILPHTSQPLVDNPPPGPL
jgi:hypothetical protein